MITKVAFIGPNGAGKTTLVKMMLGELEPMAGSVTIGNNVDVATVHGTKNRAHRISRR